MEVRVTGGELKKKEEKAYVDYLEDKYQRKLKSLDINIDGEFVDLHYTWEAAPFERIRRITGYLVGTMDRWNDAKGNEEHDRVKHSLEVPEDLQKAV